MIDGPPKYKMIIFSAYSMLLAMENLKIRNFLCIQRIGNGLSRVTCYYTTPGWTEFSRYWSFKNIIPLFATHCQTSDLSLSELFSTRRVRRLSPSLDRIEHIDTHDCRISIHMPIFGYLAMYSILTPVHLSHSRASNYPATQRPSSPRMLTHYHQSVDLLLLCKESFFFFIEYYSRLSNIDWLYGGYI